MIVRYPWQETEDAKVAPQMVFIGWSIGQEQFQPTLGVSDADVQTWREHAATLEYLQVRALFDAELHLRQVIAMRNQLMFGRGETLLLPWQAPFELPQVSVELRQGFFHWANELVKSWLRNPDFNDGMQRQVGLKVAPIHRRAHHELQGVVRKLETPSSGKLIVTVLGQRAVMHIVQLNVDGQGWPDVLKGGAHQKTTVAPRCEFDLETGRAHSVQVRTALADRQGRMLGEWSEVKVASTLA